MQFADNEPCPHLQEYITHHALNQARYLKCERVAWTPCPHPLCVHTQCTFSRRGWRINLRSSRSLLDKSSTSTIRRPPWTGDTRRRKGKEDFEIIQKMAGGGKSLGNLILETTWHATLPSKGAAGSLGRRKAWGGRMQSRITRKSSLTGN